MSWILAGISVAGSLLSNRGANKADAAASADRRRANDIQKYQVALDTEKIKSDIAIQAYNMEKDLGTLESEQVAMAAAMGKRVSSDSFENIQSSARKEHSMNMNRLASDSARASKYGALSMKALDAQSSADERATKANKKSRNIGAITTGLLTLGKAF